MRLTSVLMVTLIVVVLPLYVIGGIALQPLSAKGWTVWCICNDQLRRLPPGSVVLRPDSVLAVCVLVLFVAVLLSCLVLILLLQVQLAQKPHTVR